MRTPRPTSVGGSFNEYEKQTVYVHVCSYLPSSKNPETPCRVEINDGLIVFVLMVLFLHGFFCRKNLHKDPKQNGYPIMGLDPLILRLVLGLMEEKLCTSW